MYSIPGTSLLGITKNTSGLYILVQAPTASMTLPTTENIFAAGCLCINVADGTTYKNNGTSASPSWQNVDEISTSEIADGAVTAAKVRGSQSVTTTADGLTTGLITSPTSLITMVAITSASATNAATLPAASSALIGSVLYLTVGANGYELLTPASGNNTINQVDSDGTNQLDVAANTTVRVTCISATGWLAETIAATTIAVTAPDND